MSATEAISWREQCAGSFKGLKIFEEDILFLVMYNKKLLNEQGLLYQVKHLDRAYWDGLVWPCDTL